MAVGLNTTASGIRVSALIPAGGCSCRMHRFKPLLPLGDTTMIGAVIALFHGIGVEEVIVVTGHNHDQLAPAAEKASARVVFNPDYNAGMFSSIRAGAGEISESSQGFFLLPADIPGVRPATLEQLLDAFKRNPGTAFVPEFQGESGHPSLIPAAVLRAIREAGPEDTLQDLLFSGPAGTDDVNMSDSLSLVRLAVPDQGILMDVDTPGDYDAVKDRFHRLQIPNAAECHALMDMENLDPKIRYHLELVAEAALKFVQAVGPACPHLDHDLVRAAALLHDIRRSEPDHAWAGREFLLSMGFPRVAEIAGTHMDLVLTDTRLSEKEIVFFADRLCHGVCPDPDYEQRFKQKALAYPHARERIEQGLETARHIQTRIESAAGRSVRDILG